MRRRGYSLLEVLVAAFVGGLVMTSVYQLFTYGATLFLRGQVKTQLQSAGLASLGSLERELRRSAYSTLTIANSAISFLLEDPGTVTSAFTPQSAYVVYSEGNGILMRKTFNPGGAVVATRRLTVAELIQAQTTVNNTERILAREVASVSFTPPLFDGRQRDPEIAVTMTLDHEGTRETVSIAAFLRNQP